MSIATVNQFYSLQVDVQRDLGGQIICIMNGKNIENEATRSKYGSARSERSRRACGVRVFRLALKFMSKNYLMLNIVPTNSHFQGSLGLLQIASLKRKRKHRIEQWRETNFVIARMRHSHTDKIISDGKHKHMREHSQNVSHTTVRLIGGKAISIHPLGRSLPAERQKTVISFVLCAQ